MHSSLFLQEPKSKDFIIPQKIAHRGSSFDAPENTESAMRMAAKHGAEMIECDLQITKDKEIVIFHDDMVDRTTNGKGKLEDFTLAELKKLDCGLWKGSEFTGERILTLAELIKLINELGLKANLELKSTNDKTAINLVKKTMEILNFLDIKPGKIILSSFSRLCLLELTKYTHPYKVGLISKKWIPNIQNELKKYGCWSFHVNHKFIDKEKVISLKKFGFKCLSYTVDDANAMHYLWSIGVDSIFTNNVTLGLYDKIACIAI